MFENEVLRKIFGAKIDEITGEWTKFHYAELHTLYSSFIHSFIHSFTHSLTHSLTTEV